MSRTIVQYHCMLCGDETILEGFKDNNVRHVFTEMIEVICPTCRDKLRQAAGIELQGIDYSNNTRGLWQREAQHE